MKTTIVLKSTLITPRGVVVTVVHIPQRTMHIMKMHTPDGVTILSAKSAMIVFYDRTESNNTISTEFTPTLVMCGHRLEFDLRNDSDHLIYPEVTLTVEYD